MNYFLWYLLSVFIVSIGLSLWDLKETKGYKVSPEIVVIAIFYPLAIVICAGALLVYFIPREIAKLIYKTWTKYNGN